MSSPRPRPSPRKATPPVVPAPAPPPVQTAPPQTAPPQTAPPQTAPPQTAPPQTAPPQTAPPPPASTPLAPPPAATPALATPPPVPVAVPVSSPVSGRISSPVVGQVPSPAAAASRANPEEYTERLLVPTQMVLGAVVALVAAIVLIKLGLWPFAVVAVVVVAAVAWYLGVQELAVSRTRISIGQGRGDTSPHTIELSDVVAAAAVTLGWPECFGLGVPDTVDTTRFTVRAGPTLALTMRDGELVRISAADPAGIVARIGR